MATVRKSASISLACLSGLLDMRAEFGLEGALDQRNR